MGLSLVVAMPCYNEEGIAEFLSEFKQALRGWDGDVTYLVVDDASTQHTPGLLRTASEVLGKSLIWTRNAKNLGHGPSTIRALRLALEQRPDLVLQMDGDGQFDPADTLRLAVALEPETDAVFAVRTGRSDPWYRKMLSALLRAHLLLLFRVLARDPNCPMRLYRSETLKIMLRTLPSDPLVPSIHMTVLANRMGFRITHVEVPHRTRLGDRTQGSGWGRVDRTILVPPRLVWFAARALLETVRFRARIRRAGDSFARRQ